VIIAIQATDAKAFGHLIKSSFRLRKRVFADTLGWDVPVHGDLEYDLYDDLDPVHLVLTNSNRTRLYASLRLLPTTGPNLLHDIFAETIPDAANLSAPGIWECTRFCVDEELDALRVRHAGVPASSLLLLGLCEFGLASGISTIAANFDPAMRRIYYKAGCEVEVIGRSNAYGKRPVCCGTFEVSRRILSNMRKKLSVSQPLYEQPGALPLSTEIAA